MPLIRLSAECQRKLREKGQPGESYDAVIRRLVGLTPVTRVPPTPKDGATTRLSRHSLLNTIRTGEKITLPWEYADGNPNATNGDRMRRAIKYRQARYGYRFDVNSTFSGLEVTRLS